jgi:hypothetical protein
MYSIQTAVSDGSLTMLPLSIEYDSRDLIHVYFDGVEDARQWAWVGATDKAISFSPAVEDGVVVRVQRITPLDTVPNIYGSATPPYVGNAEFDADTIDQNFRQTLQVAQESTDRTDEAINRANEAVGIAESAVDTADQALADVSVAVGAANQAVSTANNALDVAEGIDAKAQEALDTANNAEDVALGIDAKAQSALDNSNAAVLAAAGATSTANDAKDIAEGIDAKAQSALDTANAAEQTAQDAEDAVAGVYQNASSDHWGSTEPTETFPGMTWADAIARVLKRRNDDDTAWVIESRLLTAHMPILPDTDVPATDIGPIYVVGQGDMEWNAVAGAYVLTTSAGATGGGADQVFFLNDQHVTEDYTIPVGKNAHAAGPITFDPGVTFSVSPGSRFKVI